MNQADLMTKALKSKGAYPYNKDHIVQDHRL